MTVVPVSPPAVALDATRLRRAFAADRWDAPEALVQVLLKRRSVASARADYARAARAAGRADSAVVVLDDWLAGDRADPWLELARGAGIAVDELLGTHELALAVVRRTVARCVEHDHGEPRRELSDRAALAVGRALGPALLALQQGWFAHRSPTSVVHFPRLLRGEDLRAARTAYVEAVGMAAERSVVGWIERRLHGTPEEVRGLVQWDDVALGQRSDRPGPIRLTCGVVLDEHAGDATPATFSVLELLERDRNVFLSDVAADGPPPEGRVEPEELSSLPAGSSVVDRLLLLIGRLCGAGRGVDWLPDLPDPVPPLLPSAPEPVLLAIARDELTLAWTGRNDPADVPDLLGTALAVGDADAEVAAALDAIRALSGAAPAEDWVAAWRRALQALLLWRAGRVIAALADHVAAEATRFPVVADRWLAYDPVGDRPGSRRRTAGRQRTDDGAGNAFALDPVGSPDDQRLIATTWRLAYDPPALATWLLNEWTWGVGLLGLACGPARGVVAALHPRIGGPRDLTAFKKSVSSEGYVCWSLTEIDRAAEIGRARWGGGLDARAWRRACRRSARLPTRAWPASWPPDGDPPRLERLAAMLAGRSGP